MNQIEQAIKLLNEVEQKKSDLKKTFDNLPDAIATNEYNQLSMIQNKDLLELELDNIESGMMKIIEREAEEDTTKSLSNETKRKTECKKRLSESKIWIEKQIELRSFIESLRKNEIDTDRLKRRFRVIECFLRLEE